MPAKPASKSDRYHLRLETTDGTLEEGCVFYRNRRLALQSAARWARDNSFVDVTRIWVDDIKTGLGVMSFPVKRGA